jgi:hypothetical protein
MRFIDGLKDEIKPIVLVQRPQDLDTACVLAALQEEAGDSYTRKAYSKSESSYSHKLVYKNPLPLPAPPVRDKPAVPLVSDDKRGVEAAHARSSPDAKAAALRAYRRALGLCYKCSEKWTKDHRCSPTVQLHAVQELWELFQLEDDSDYVSPVAEDMFEHVFLAISKAAVRGSAAPRTVKFVGSIQHKSVTLLVDSGRSSSFISASVAAQLSGVFPLPTSVTG